MKQVPCHATIYVILFYLRYLAWSGVKKLHIRRKPGSHSEKDDSASPRSLNQQLRSGAARPRGDAAALGPRMHKDPQAAVYQQLLLASREV